ncbi:MAG: VCBS repeat-containing protein [Verrucomicrobiae bacterium]|nr:VCBS repeat-containing protein [Verrucomicrobiae bacterium]
MKKPIAFVPSFAAFVLASPSLFAAPPEFRWEEKEIDQIEIGYGLQLTDVDGDGKTDIVLADKNTIQWYANPGWEKHVIARDLTKRDNVCVTARDIDGDGKCEIAVGGQWNFLETMKDGAVFYLVAPKDRTQLWKPVPLPHEPNTHRMHWVRGAGENEYSLVVKPLRGIGSVDGEGPGLRILEYFPPDDPGDAGEWKRRIVGDQLNLSHNFHPVNWDGDPEEELIVAAKQGVWYFDRVEGEWQSRQLTGNFAGEIRDGKLPNGRRFIVTVEPMHGTASAVYVEPEDGGEGLWPPLTVLDDHLKDGHAIAVADYLGTGSDQIVVGWRAMHPKEVPGEPGIKLFTPMTDDGSEWRETKVSGSEVAVEDIKAADLNGDGLADIVAAARQTKNLKIFFAAP